MRFKQPSRRDRPVMFKRSKNVSVDVGVDSISDLPDAVLQHIFSYIPTELAIRTSVLSKRWRHVWSETPHLSFEWLKVSPKLINKTLASYTASKIKSFHLCTRYSYEADTHHVNSSIEFAMSHNVDDLSLAFRRCSPFYNFDDCFYTNSSLKRVELRYVDLMPRCMVSWTSLKNLSLTDCTMSDESFLEILSGCPILESLSLKFCMSLKYLNLSKSLRLTRLEIERISYIRAPMLSMQIVAPYIHYLRLRDSEAHCTFVDVSSLTEANVDVSTFHPRTCYHDFDPLDPHDLLVMVQTMLKTFQKVEKLTLGVNLLQMLSLSKIPSLPLPMLKVKTLTLETMIIRSVVPGIARLLQNLPGLKKITVYTTNPCNTEVEPCVNSYLDAQDLNPDQWWRLDDVVFPISSEYEVLKPEIMASFMELLLANTRTLETLVVELGSCVARSRFKELFQIALTLSHDKKVSIMLKRSNG
ncbi:putative protein [Arabidopsis thaliana]|uniref:Putative F-box/LRR-repeat protein At5g02930 n=1 Tax=Arabidopsis thaliana TaxID=3702 RepID=FBL80_ARATH|nr:F-box/RNI-like superfamily protein [Arabidopsis thaliana]Q9LYZ2.1 RecName: Full=Putative F-box/LRR-repeat protein At5g02930 [Arabidopsis thaliana]AED90537.1 F-box/RNI-like superfamily protein [Arabidopsis thaliana]CAB86047.1 putative protein [Arabidopsis thaliana]|eukprot:NP_195913.1 F-box/RNI-like superfamily protein [Arabidopsis thaliana]